MRGFVGVMAAAVLVASAQAKVAFEMCSDSLNDFGIESIELPEFVVAGEQIAVDIVQKPNRAVGKGLVVVEVDVEGVKVARETYSLCEVTSCHSLVAHQKSSSRLWMALPALMPAGFDTSVKVIINDHNGAQLSCVDVSGVRVDRKTALGGAATVLRASADEDQSLTLGADELELLWTKWKQEHGMRFEAEEDAQRKRVFAENLEHVAVHNNKDDESYKMGLNEFAHLTSEEFSATRFGLKGDALGAARNEEFYVRDMSARSLREADLPSEVDWRKKNVVTPVKNQGSCGSCWSFSATGAMEGAYALKTGKLVSFSEQELVSCDPVDQGCNGGLMDNAFRFIMSHNGLCSEEEDPYVSGSGFAPRSCKKCTPVEGSVPKSFVDVQHSEGSLEEAVAKNPVAIAIEADQLAFQFYKKGVLTGNCGARLDHGVLAVGYGTLNGTDYWIVKNSWGAGWGMNGYILLQRGKKVRGGECGILMSASYPVF